MKKWLSLIISTVAFFLTHILFDIIFSDPVDFFGAIISTIIFIVIMIVLYLLKIIKFK